MKHCCLDVQALRDGSEDLPPSVAVVNDSITLNIAKDVAASVADVSSVVVSENLPTHAISSGIRPHNMVGGSLLIEQKIDKYLATGHLHRAITAQSDATASEFVQRALKHDIRTQTNRPSWRSTRHPICEILWPCPNSVSQPPSLLGAEAIAPLRHILRGPEPNPPKAVPPCRLAVRGSTLSLPTHRKSSSC